MVKRVLPMPTLKQKSDLIQDALRKKRKHRKRWPKPPEDSTVFLMHFAVHSHAKHHFHAEMTLEVPSGANMTTYYTSAATRSTEALALRAVIEQMESETWYHHFRRRGVVFRVTGCMETLYRGYLYP